MGYVIKATYQTGDSFHSEEANTELSGVWQTLAGAKEALRWLNEHHVYYEDINSRWDQKEHPDLETRLWYVKGEGIYRDIWGHCLNLLMDDGTLRRESIPYHGYFETLHSLEILCEKDGDLSFTYN